MTRPFLITLAALGFPFCCYLTWDGVVMCRFLIRVLMERCRNNCINLLTHSSLCRILYLQVRRTNMTYGELSNAKTFGFVTNHVIDDAVNNAIFEHGSKNWRNEVVSNRDSLKIIQSANREGVQSPFMVVAQ